MVRHARLAVVVGFVALVGVGSMIAADRSSAAMATAASKFLAALTPEQRQQATFAFASTEERQHWGFVPTEMFPRKGLLVRDLTGPQRTLVHELLKAGLSQRGYLTASQIMDLESVLDGIERAERARTGRGEAARALERDPVKYFVSVFGAPSPRET